MRKSLKTKVMSEITKKGIKMTPKWVFWAWEAGIKSVWAAVVLMGAVGLSAVILFWRRYEPIRTIGEYGEVGREVIVTDFPYWWLTMGILALLMGSFLLTKMGQIYREPFEKLMIGMAGAIVATSIILRLVKIAL